ncbi:hypothetical protein [Aeromonas enteropelogenes]
MLHLAEPAGEAIEQSLDITHITKGHPQLYLISDRLLRHRGKRFQGWL